MQGREVALKLFSALLCAGHLMERDHAVGSEPMRPASASVVLPHGGKVPKRPAWLLVADNTWMSIGA